MHRVIQDHLEEVLAEPDAGPIKIVPPECAAHLAECAYCREEIATMLQQSSMLSALRPPENATEEVLMPRPGFYARVLERIEAQRPISIWQLFFDSDFGRRIAIASMAMSLFFAIYLVSSERFAQPISVGAAASEDLTGQTLYGNVQPAVAFSQAGLPDKDAVLVNLVTYRGQ